MRKKHLKKHEKKIIELQSVVNRLEHEVRTVKYALNEEAKKLERRDGEVKALYDSLKERSRSFNMMAGECRKAAEVLAKIEGTAHNKEFKAANALGILDAANRLCASWDRTGPNVGEDSCGFKEAGSNFNA